MRPFHPPASRARYSRLPRREIIGSTAYLRCAEASHRTVHGCTLRPSRVGTLSADYLARPTPRTSEQEGTATRSVLVARDAAGDSVGSEELSCDDIGDPGPPFGERPAPLFDEELLRGAVDDGEVCVYGAASVHPRAKMTVLDQKAGQDRLGRCRPSWSWRINSRAAASVAAASLMTSLIGAVRAAMRDVPWATSRSFASHEAPTNSLNAAAIA
jgi:hypothetical protein